MDEMKIKDWQRNISGGLQYMKDYAKPINWDLYRNYYRGIFDVGTAGQRKYSVAIIFAILRSMVPKTYFTDPTVYVSHTVPGFGNSARIVQKLDNKMIESTKLKYVLKPSILQAALCGTCPVLTGFDSEYGYKPELKATVLDNTGVEVSIGGTLTRFNEKGNLIEYDNYIRPGKPWAIEITPEFFIVPYGLKYLHQAPWVARLYIRELEDVKQDKKMSHTQDLKANGMTTFDWMKNKHITSKIPQNRFGDFVFLWEIRDLKRGRMMIMQEGYNKWLYNEVDLMQKYGNPYLDLNFNPDPIYYYGIPDSKYLEDQQLAINETRTLHMEHRRLAKLRFLYDQNIISEDEVIKLVTEDAGAGIKCDGNVEAAVKIFQPYVPPDFNIDVEAIRGDAREISGFSRNEVGEFEGGRQTATESQIVHMASQIRVNERKDLVADLLVDIIKRYNAYMFSEWEKEQVEDIIGPDGIRYWVKFTNKQIESDYAFKVDPENSNPTSIEVRRQEAIMLAQYLQNSPVVQSAVQSGKPVPYDFTALDRYVAQQFQGVPIDEIMPPSAGIGMNEETPIPLEELNRQMLLKGKMAAGGGAGAKLPV
jgi:hypothetical protein